MAGPVARGSACSLTEGHTADEIRRIDASVQKSLLILGYVKLVFGGGDLAGHHDEPGGDQRFGGYTAVFVLG